MRLTKRDGGGNAVMDCDNCEIKYRESCCSKQLCRNALINKLAAYEDTGLTPETCKDIKSLCDDYVDAGLDASFILACIAAARAGISSKRMTEISKAETDNRLIILPCKVGDTVFSTFEDEDVFCGKVYAISTCDGTNWFSVRYDIGLRYDHTWDDFGKTVFLTREEAEAALKGKSKDV